MSLLPTSPGHPHTYFSPGLHTYIHTPNLSSTKHTHTLLDPDIPFKPNQTAPYFGGKNVCFLLNCPSWEVQAVLPGCIRTSSLFTTPRNVQAHGVAKSVWSQWPSLPARFGGSAVTKHQDWYRLTQLFAFQNRGKVRECGLFTTE